MAFKRFTTALSTTAGTVYAAVTKSVSQAARNLKGKLSTGKPPADCYKMLLIGETGSGKTSFLNLICNCSLVQELGFEEGCAQFNAFNDIKLENAVPSKMESKTSGVKLYDVKLCGLNMGVVDTPGFGDSRGMDKDKLHTQLIIDALKEEEYLNCVCMIINGRQSRMSATLRYVLTEITSILPREIVNNVIVVFTNTADPLDLSFDPKSLQPFFGKEIEPERIFYIENPYCRFEKAKQLQGTLPPEHIARSLKKSFEDTSIVLSEMSTTMKDFERVHTNHFVTLYQKKQEIEAKVISLLTAYDNQQNLEKDIAKAEEEATSALERKTLNSEFESTQTFKRWIVVETDSHNTLCGAAHCHSNCHAPCYLPKSFDKETFKGCRAMGGSDTCRQCEHSYKLHYHNEVIFEEEESTKPLLDDEMKKKFEEAKTMEEMATILKQELQSKREASERERQQLSDRLLSTLEEFRNLGINRSYAKLLENQLAVIQHRLEGSVGPETEDLRKTKEKIEKKLQLVTTTLTEHSSPNAESVQQGVVSEPTRHEIEKADQEMARSNRKPNNGLGLVTFGLAFLFLGVVLFYYMGLAIVNILFIAGVVFIFGLKWTYRFFFQAHKLKGTAVFMGGILIVLIGWPIVGMLVELYGAFSLFCGQFPHAILLPHAILFLRRAPAIEHLVNRIKTVVDRLADDSTSPA